jgi:hypothetical protein
MPSLKICLLRIVKETHKEHPRMAQGHGKHHQRPLCPTDIHLAEMSPVDLRFFTGQFVQPQKSFALWSRSQASNVRTEL